MLIAANRSLSFAYEVSGIGARESCASGPVGEYTTVAELDSTGWHAIHVLDNFQIPEIPTSFLQLMGLSNGVYLASKFLPSTSEKKPAASPGS